MRILVTGAYGFIASHIVSALIRQGHHLVCAVRDTKRAQRKYPSCDVIACDFNRDTHVETWLPRLKNIDVVINLVGILQSKTDNIHAIHTDTPKALFTACVQANVKKIIHFSALGIDDETKTDYSSTKRLADNHLKTLMDIDWIILQPSLIYGSEAYGGTALMKSLAAMPFFIPIIGDGKQLFQPVHMDDVVKTVLHFVEKKNISHQKIAVVGPQPVAMRDILQGFRQWLGLKPTTFLSMPKSFMRWFAKLGDIASHAPLNSTAFNMLEHGNTADPTPFIEETGIQPLSFSKGLETTPTTIQSLWFAYLFNLKPFIRLILGLFWFFSGFITAFINPTPAYEVLQNTALSNFKEIILYASCGLDMVLGIALLLHYRLIAIANIQLAIIVIYTVILSFFAPQLWLSPFGDLLKNIPIIVLTLVMIAIERDK